jgi:hypothetical protein
VVILAIVTAGPGEEATGLGAAGHRVAVCAVEHEARGSAGGADGGGGAEDALLQIGEGDQAGAALGDVEVFICEVTRDNRAVVADGLGGMDDDVVAEGDAGGGEPGLDGLHAVEFGPAEATGVTVRRGAGLAHRDATIGGDGVDAGAGAAEVADVDRAVGGPAEGDLFFVISCMTENLGAVATDEVGARILGFGKQRGGMDILKAIGLGPTEGVVIRNQIGKYRVAYKNIPRSRDGRSFGPKIVAEAFGAAVRGPAIGMI